MGLAGDLREESGQDECKYVCAWQLVLADCQFAMANPMAEEQRYIVTARKWRPLRFEDVVGQEHITTTLKNAIAKQRVHHAYLFTGPRGVGKTTCARILARALNCTQSVDFEPCNSCASCTDMLDGRSVDIIEIDGASNNSVEDVRKLRDNAKYAPVVGKYKMYIIDEVHMLSTSAFNALLKTLEEPPPHLIFVFATTEIHKVPATILSRCQRFDFRRMEIETITGHLRHITAKEGITIDEASLVAIAKKADGSMRDSQSILDQVVSFCGTTISSAEVSNALHLIDTDFYFELSTAITQHDLPSMFTHARTVVQRGYDLQECLLGLLEHFRNILTVITTGNTELIEASSSDLDRYAAAASEFTKADVLRIMTLITQGESVLRHNPPQPRIRFEFTLVQLASMDSTVDLGNVLAMLNAPSIPATVPPRASTQVVGGVAMAQPIPVRLGTPVIMKTQEKPVSSLSAGNIAKQWSKWIESLPEHLSFVHSAVKQSVLTVDITDVGIVLRPQAEIIYHRLEDKLQQLKEYLTATYGTSIGVNLVRPRQNGTPQAPSQPNTQQGTSVAESTFSAAQHRETLLPIEETLVELFSARRATAPRK